MTWQDFAPASTTRQREAIEWSISYAFNTADTAAPRVLLIGDSICNGYHDSVRTKLEGKVNLSFWASSKCVTDPDYLRELDFILGGYRYDIVCFNNGLHSFGTNRTEWDAAYRAVIAFIRAKLPDALLSLTLCTPLTDAGESAKSASLNETIRAVAHENDLPVIDLFGAMDPLSREEYWADTCHFRAPAVQIQSDLLRDHILSRLGLSQ